MLKKIFNKISAFLENNAVHSREKKRLADDLGVVYERLSKREYRIMDYSLKNKFNVPERTEEFFHYLENYCLTGMTWSKIINKLHVKKQSEIVDLCSGWAPKVTLALFYSGFKGKMVLFDKNKKSMNALRKFMRLFNPSYVFENIEADIVNYSGRQFPFVIANHVIDDLILDLYCTKHAISTKTIYEKEDTIRGLWDKIVDDTLFYRETKELLSVKFDALISQGGILCFAQYTSMMEWLLGLDNSVACSKSMMHEIAESLESKWYTILHDVPKKAIWNFKWAFLPEECVILQK